RTCRLSSSTSLPASTARTARLSRSPRPGRCVRSSSTPGPATCASSRTCSSRSSSSPAPRAARWPRASPGARRPAAVAQPTSARGGVVVALVLRATPLHSVNEAPLIYRVVSNVNDLDAVEGLAPPGRVVELWFRQRNFKEGTDDASDPFAWCGWKNGGDAVRIGIATADAGGVWRLSDLRHTGTTVMLFPPAPGGDRCL